MLSLDFSFRIVKKPATPKANELLWQISYLKILLSVFDFTGSRTAALREHDASGSQTRYRDDS